MSQLELINASIVRHGRTLLDSVSFLLRTGDFVALMGPNGSGKSTLLRVLAGLWSTDPKGRTLIDGKELREISRRDIAKRIAYVPQEVHLTFPFTVREVVGMGRYPHRGRFDRETSTDRNAINWALEVCDVAHLERRTVNTLSGGERQRVLIARGLAVEPDFILLDEPTANLDIEHALRVNELCRSLAATGCGVVVASHDLNAMMRQSSKVALMSAGRLLAVQKQEEDLDLRQIREVFHVSAERLIASDGSEHFVFGLLPSDPPQINRGTRRML